VKSGRVLSAREERILSEYQEGQKPASERKTWVHGGKNELGNRLGVDRRTINNWSHFKDFPKARPNGDYPLEDIIAWVKERGFKGGEQSITASLKERELLAKINKLEFQIEVDKGNYILLSEAERDTTQLAGHAMNILRSKFEGELPPALVGLSTAEIQVKCKQAVDEVCALLSR
jgi:hypothetical protein